MPSKTQQIKQQISQPISNKVSGVQWGLMIATALFFDVCKGLLQLIPIVGQILAIVVGWFAFATFWLWFTILGAKYSKGTMLAGFLSDFIPVLDVFSETGTILALYIKSKEEKIVSKVPGGKTALQMAVAKQQSRTVSYTHTDGSTDQNSNLNIANRQPLPQRQYTPGVTEMPKRNPNQNDNLLTEKKVTNKVVDIGAARERLDRLKQQNAYEKT